jgi:hypothetical protein
MLYYLEWRPPPECFLACRQIYAEAALLPLSLRTFNFRCSGSAAKSFIKLMQPPQLAEVQAVALDPVFLITQPTNTEDLETTFNCMTGLKTIYLGYNWKPSPYSDMVDDIVSGNLKSTDRQVIWLPQDFWIPWA